jgi:uncharacterized protein (DUF1501 family)
MIVFIEGGRNQQTATQRGQGFSKQDAFLLAGGAIAGGRLIGDFGGLTEKSLNEGRDLPVLADWSALFAACLRDTCGISDAALSLVFPGRPRQTFEV